MSTVVLTNWRVYYADDAPAGSSGYKQIKWFTASSGTNTLNELYSELMHVFDIPANNNASDSTPLKAVTPTLYEIGTFDAGDREPWFIDPESIKHLSGGGLNTVNWTRDVTARTGSIGIVKFSYTVGGGTNFAVSDIGRTITSTPSTGTLLHFENNTAWVRPTDSTSTHDWSGTPTDVSVTGGTGLNLTQSAASTSAENIYANIYTIGTIVDNTEIYVTQSDALLPQWWNTGHIDILVLVSDQGTLIDNGLLRVFARQYNTLYDHFEAIVANGGRNPIPLATADDINNENGYVLLNCSVGSGTFEVGEVIGNNNVRASATALGVITNVAGTVSDPDLTVYMIGDLTAFTGADTVQSYSTTAQADVDTVSATGPNATIPATITTTFGGAQYDLGNGFGNAWYSVAIDCQGELISSVYERLKYITRRGQTTDVDAGAQIIYGEQYQGIGELYIPFDTGSVLDPFTAGNTVTVSTTFSGTITAKHKRADNQGFLIVRDYSGTIPVDGNTLNDGTHTADVDDNTGLDPVATISPNKQSPFGSFAGGKFFGARGVYIFDMHANDTNNYSLIDSEGNQQNPPSTVSTVITVQALADASVIAGANVLVWATNNDNYFFEASVSITGSGTTATVTHTTHGIITGDYVMIKGVTNDDDYNGAYQVTVTDPNTYTYTATETLGATPATGAPTATFVFISAATNGSGVASDTRSLSADQAISGWVRKSSGSPYYQQGVISGTISTTSGFSTTIQLASDE